MNLQEKTLTPAELKKREEIAKAMERDEPGMDMSKKMAIATAAAKRVAEATTEKNGNEWKSTGKTGKHLGTGERTFEYAEVDKDGERTGARHYRNIQGKVVGESKEIVFDDEPIEELSANTLSSYVNKAVMKPGKLPAAKRAHDKIKEKGASKMTEAELVEFAIGTKVHHPHLGPKGGEVVKPEQNGFNGVGGVRGSESSLHVKASNGKVYKMAAHSLKPVPSDKETEKMKPLTKNALRKESVIRSSIERAQQLSIVESVPIQLMSFKNYAEVHDTVLSEGYHDTYKSVIDWSDMGGSKPQKKYDDSDDDIYGASSKVHKAKPPAAQPKEKKNVGRPAGDYGTYKIDAAKRNSDVYKAEISAKVKAAKADGFAARNQFKELMDKALRQREKELFGNK